MAFTASRRGRLLPARWFKFHVAISMKDHPSEGLHDRAGRVGTASRPRKPQDAPGGPPPPPGMLRKPHKWAVGAFCEPGAPRCALRTPLRTLAGHKTRGSCRLAQKCPILLARSEGFEPPTPRFKVLDLGRCLIGLF
jgi:hypothetical protein